MTQKSLKERTSHQKSFGRKAQNGMKKVAGDFIYAGRCCGYGRVCVQLCIDVWGHVNRMAVGEVGERFPVACISNFPDKNTGRCRIFFIIDIEHSAEELATEK